MSLDPLIAAFALHADIGHLALLAWGVAATFMAARLLRAVEAASRRFDGFVGELARFNARFDDPQPQGEAHEPGTGASAERPKKDSLDRNRDAFSGPIRPPAG
jgi:hypothetical protein